MGNVIGSINFLWVLGISALIRPLPFDLVSNIDLVMVIVSSTLLLLSTAVGRPNTVDRWEGGPSWRCTVPTSPFWASGAETLRRPGHRKCQSCADAACDTFGPPGDIDTSTFERGYRSRLAEHWAPWGVGHRQRFATS